MVWLEPAGTAAAAAAAMVEPSVAAPAASVGYPRRSRKPLPPSYVSPFWTGGSIDGLKKRALLALERPDAGPLEGLKIWRAKKKYKGILMKCAKIWKGNFIPRPPRFPTALTCSYVLRRFSILSYTERNHHQIKLSKE